MDKPPQYLLVDIGNTRLKWVSASPTGPIQPAGEMATAEATSERVEALAREFSHHYVIVASVVPRLVGLFARFFPDRLHLVSSHSSGLGFRFDYPKPPEIGADRLAAAVAVYTDGQWPAIIVQCGTATAISVLNSEGKFCGGAIAPGLEAQLDSLIGVTAQLPRTDLHLPATVPARSTEEAVRAGVLLNFRGGVKEILQTLIDTLPPSSPPVIVLTGGNAGHLEGKLGRPCALRPLLVFEGLRIMGTTVFKPPLPYSEK
ncbi:MAG: type III pantothenate kinase [Methylacidiphilales bacterium]|nr:type III pantothenate kinase [Candidatus Methylacidiphilales bacterium]